MNVVRRASGYTMIDILVCGTIVACLSAIAVPSYHRTVLKERRTVARNTLVDLAARQDDHRRVHRTFAHDVGALVGAHTSAPYLRPNGGWLDRPEKDGIYRLEVLDAAHADLCGHFAPDASGTPVALSATTAGPQISDQSCRQLILCFDGRPGAKAAFDDQGYSTPDIRNACWGLQEN